MTIVTQVAVDPKDPAFATPSKPVGPFYSRGRGEEEMLEKGTAMREDAGRGCRRVVPSPEPARSSSSTPSATSRTAARCHLLRRRRRARGAQPRRPPGHRRGIDKDLAAALLAQELGADALLILTDVPRAYIGYGTPSRPRSTG